MLRRNVMLAFVSSAIIFYDNEHLNFVFLNLPSGLVSILSFVFVSNELSMI